MYGVNDSVGGKKRSEPQTSESLSSASCVFSSSANTLITKVEKMLVSKEIPKVVQTVQFRGRVYHAITSVKPVLT